MGFKEILTPKILHFRHRTEGQSLAFAEVLQHTGWLKKRQWLYDNYLFSGDTPWKTNMSYENQWLEDVFPIEIVPFQETC